MKPFLTVLLRALNFVFQWQPVAISKFHTPSDKVYDGLPVGLTATCNNFICARITCNGKTQWCTDLTNLFLVPKFGLNSVKLVVFGLGTKDESQFHIWADRILINTKTYENDICSVPSSFSNSTLKFSQKIQPKFTKDNLNFTSPNIHISSIQFEKQFDFEEHTN